MHQEILYLAKNALFFPESHDFLILLPFVLSYLGGSSCMVKMRPKLPLHGTAKKLSFWGGPKTQEPKIL